MPLVHELKGSRVAVDCRKTKSSKAWVGESRELLRYCILRLIPRTPAFATVPINLPEHGTLDSGIHAIVLLAGKDWHVGNR